jgi:hypothetical protein
LGECDNPSLVEEINGYLSVIQEKGSTELWGDYLRNNPSPFALYHEILRVVSTNNNPDDWEAFSQKKIQMHAYIKELLTNYGTVLSGDVNSDGKVDVTDVQACVNYILGMQNYGAAAVVNKDGKVDVTDVQAIVNIILGA